MPEITGVRERRGRAGISVDGEFWAELDAAVAAERGLREGAAFSREELDEARVAGERPLAMGRALNLLGYRARSEGEMRERLGRYGYGEGTAEVVVSRLLELGYLDDEEFARQKAREKARRYGPRRVSADLLKSGVGREVAAGAVEEEFAGRSELEDARSAAARRYNGVGSEAEARRVYGFLARRGYSTEVCAEVAGGYRGPAQS
ncbi:MAG: regulatory protein RecX [Rubrobacteraceae bacterium]|nr:regulatory protein RecX [Rubrobacteraceae bacterium]